MKRRIQRKNLVSPESEHSTSRHEYPQIKSRDFRGNYTEGKIMSTDSELDMQTISNWPTDICKMFYCRHYTILLLGQYFILYIFIEVKLYIQ